MPSTITSAQVEAAILDVIQNGQSVTVGDRTYTAADLDALRKLYQEVVAAERAEANKTFTRATFGRVT